MATPIRLSGTERDEREPRSATLAFIETLEVVIAAGREVGANALDQLQARVEAWRARLDPATQRWVEQARKSLVDGSFEERVREQPSPAELVEQVKRARKQA